MTIMKRMLCVFMCLLMLFSSLSAVSLAAEEITYSLKHYTEKSDTYNADLSLDKADKLLSDNKDSLYFEVKQNTIFGGEKVLLTVDLTSVNAICKTIDDYKGVLTLAGPFMGDLKDLDFSTWKTGMTREKTGDIVLIKELIELINANRGLVQKICNSEADLGLIQAFFDINSLLGKDGISGFIKGFIVDLVYDKDNNAAQYNAAYERAKNDFDSFLFTDLLYKFVTSSDGLLPGFTMNKNSTVEDIIIVGFGLVIDKYVAPALKELDIDLSDYGEELKNLSALLNLKGSTYDFSKVRFTSGASLLSQINNVIGEILKQLVPSYTAWQKGDYTLIEKNVEGVFRYLAKGSGLIENADSLTYEELMFEVVSLIMGKIGFDEGVQNCKSLEDLVSVLIINVANELHIGVNYKGNEHYTVVLGDILAWLLYDYINLTDLSGVTYTAGGGKDIWEVLNYVLNYLFFQKDLAGFTGIAVSKTDTLFTKIDKFIDCFGENKNVNFDSKKFLMGDETQKGIIDSVFTLDLQNIIDITAVKALNCAGDVPVIEFIYKTLMYVLNNWSGTQMFPPYTATRPLNTALQNDNLSVMIKDAIETINARKDYAVPLTTLIIALIFKEEPSSKGEITVTAKEGSEPQISVKFGSATLTKGKDYIIREETNDLSQKVITFRFTDNYSGSAVLPVLSKTQAPKAVISEGKVNLSWTAAPGATEYEIYVSENSGSFSKLISVTGTESVFANAKNGNKYSFKVKPIAKDDYAVSYGLLSAEASVTLPLDKVKNLEITDETNTSLSLSWQKVNGADKYEVYLYSGGWKKLTTLSGTSYTVKDLKAHTSYKVKVRAYNSKNKTYGDFSDTVTERTSLSKVSKIKSKNVKDTSVRVYWSKVSSADTYLLYQYSGGKWKRIAKTKDTAYNVKSLSPNKTYYFKVRAYNSSSKELGEFSPNVKVITNPSKVKKLKASSVKATSLKLSWQKVSGATAYQVYRSTNGSSWTKVATVSSKNTYYNEKKAKKNTRYYYKVRAYRKSGSKVYYGDFSSAVKVTTKKK